MRICADLTEQQKGLFDRLSRGRHRKMTNELTRLVIKEIDEAIASGELSVSDQEQGAVSPDQGKALEVFRRFAKGTAVPVGDLAIAATGLGVSTAELVTLAEKIGLKKGNGNPSSEQSGVS